MPHLHQGQADPAGPRDGLISFFIHGVLTPRETEARGGTGAPKVPGGVDGRNKTAATPPNPPYFRLFYAFLEPTELPN